MCPRRFHVNFKNHFLFGTSDLVDLHTLQGTFKKKFLYDIAIKKKLKKQKKRSWSTKKSLFLNFLLAISLQKMRRIFF